MCPYLYHELCFLRNLPKENAVLPTNILLFDEVGDGEARRYTYCAVECCPWSFGLKEQMENKETHAYIIRTTDFW